MQPTVTDVALCMVCVFGTQLHCAKTAEPIEMLFGRPTCFGRRNHILDEGSHWRNLANMMDRPLWRLQGGI